MFGMNIYIRSHMHFSICPSPTSYILIITEPHTCETVRLEMEHCPPPPTPSPDPAQLLTLQACLFPRSQLHPQQQSGGPLGAGQYVCVCVCVCARAVPSCLRASVCVYMCMRACVPACMCCTFPPTAPPTPFMVALAPPTQRFTAASDSPGPSQRGVWHRL